MSALQAPDTASPPTLAGEALDAFGGAGGWDEGAKELGIEPLGLELDLDACKTREQAGLRTYRGDVSQFEPADFAPVGLFIASPPCPTFSAAGSGRGHDVIEVIRECLSGLARGQDTRAQRREEAFDILHAAAIETEKAKAKKRGREPDFAKARATADRDATASMLVVEPLRWILALRPEYVALEQVPPVLELWRATGEHLREVGYGVWTGILEAERYGVPQTRERAILMATRGGGIPAATPSDAPTLRQGRAADRGAHARRHHPPLGQHG